MIVMMIVIVSIFVGRRFGVIFFSVWNSHFECIAEVFAVFFWTRSLL